MRSSDDGAGVLKKMKSKGGKMAIPGLKDHIRGVMMKMMRASKGESGKFAKVTKKGSLKKDIIDQQSATGMLLHTRSGR